MRKKSATNDLATDLWCNMRFSSIFELKFVRGDQSSIFRLFSCCPIFIEFYLIKEQYALSKYDKSFAKLW